MKETADLEHIIQKIEAHGMRNWLIEAFATAFSEARKGKLKTYNEHAFNQNWMPNIVHLVDAILGNYYKPSPSISFIVFDPMIREIFAAPFADRIVHHFLYDLQGGWWDHHFIHDSYSCRENKGTLYGILRTQKMIRQATQNFTQDAVIVKLDIKGYFMSLPRKKLYQRIKWGLKRQFEPYIHTSSAAYELYRICCYLWYIVLMDDPASKSRRRGPLSNWKNLPPEKSLYCQLPGLGIVIGNLTSQLVSNIYLDQLDRFVKYTLGYKYYGRYVDDFFIIVPADQYAKLKKDIKKIEKYLRDELQLTLHPKKRYFQSVYKGVNFLGARIYPHCYYPSNRLQSKLNAVLRNLDQVSSETVASYFGLYKHLNGEKYVHRLFVKYGLDFRLYQEFQSPTRTRSVLEIIRELKIQRTRAKTETTP